jgi:hypothetical protein
VDAPAQPDAAAELTATLLTTALTLHPGESGELTVSLHNQAAGDVHGEAQLISPYALWPVSTPWTQPFAVAAGGDSTLSYRITVPPGAEPGQWWALVKVMYFGRLRYTPTASITIADPDGQDAGAAAGRSRPATTGSAR